MDLEEKISLKNIYEITEENFWLAQRIKTKDKIICLPWQTIKDYLQELKVIDKKYNSYLIEPNYRTILSNEIILESDKTKEENQKLMNQITKKLKQKSISYKTYFSGNKSIHCHIFFDKTLSNIPKEQREEAKRKWTIQVIGKELFEQLDPALFRPKQLCLIKNCCHPKTGKPKTLIEKNVIENGINEFPKNIIEDLKEPIKKIGLDIEVTEINCPAVEFVINNYCEDGTGRQDYLAPNVSALTRTHKNKEELRKKFYETQHDIKPNCLECWDTIESDFRCLDLQQYMHKINKQTICHACLLAGGGING